VLAFKVNTLHTMEEIMGWILFGLFLFFIIVRMTGGAEKGNDDFTGNNTTSYFLLDEFISESSGKEDEPNQGERFQEQEEDGWFEDEFG
jgi:hypothetical protein